MSLKSYGFFGDTHEVEDAAGLLPDRDLVAEYLKQAPALVVATGFTGCLFDQTTKLELSVKTDGHWQWPAALEHYVRHHGVGLPDELVTAINAAEFRPPDIAHDELIALDEAMRSQAPQPWVLVRQDTHGTRFDVERFESRNEADAAMATFESGYPHHQTYFVEHRS